MDNQRNNDENALNVLRALKAQRGRKLRVLLLAHSTTRTGSPLVALSLFENLRDEVDVFTVSLDRDALFDRFEKLGPTHTLFDEKSVLAQRLPRGVVLRLNGKMTQPRLRKWGTPDLIYINSITGLHLARYIKVGDAPAILHIHELDEGLNHHPQRAPNLFFRWPCRYIAVAQVVREAMCHFGIEDEKIAVVHEWIETDSVSPKPPREADAPWIIGASGHVSWRKGIDLWLLMAARLVQIIGRERVRFVWVGLDDSGEARQARLKARKMGLESVVEWIPVTSNPHQHFARFDVFAMTSWEDPCPLVVLENMLLQTPVACFAPGGGASEEIGDTGIIIDGFDPHEMAQQIASLLQDEARLKTLGERARHRVLDLFTAQSQVPKIARLMGELLDGH